MTNAPPSRKPTTGQRLLEATLFLSVAWCFAQAMAQSGSQVEAGVLGLAVVLVAGRHGLAAGLACGLSAAGLAWLGTGHALADLVTLKRDPAELGSVYTLVALGGVVGLAAEGHRRALSPFRVRLDRLRQHKTMQDELMAVIAADKSALEQRFANERLPVAAIAREAEELTAVAPDMVPQGALAIASRRLGASAAGYYAVDGADLRLTAGLGLGGEADDLPHADGIICRAMRSGELLAARTLEERIRSGAWLAAPVLAADGACCGVLVIHEIPFARLTPVTQAAFSALANRLGAALSAPRRRVPHRRAETPLWSANATTVRIEAAPLEGAASGQYGLSEAS